MLAAGSKHVSQMDGAALSDWFAMFQASPRSSRQSVLKVFHMDEFNQPSVWACSKTQREYGKTYICSE
eukprot:12399734-Karenia_brevis.AAC.1